MHVGMVCIVLPHVDLHQSGVQNRRVNTVTESRDESEAGFTAQPKLR